VSKKLKSGLGSMKRRAQQNGKVFHAVQVIMALVTLYLFVAISIYLPQHPAEITLANMILLGTLFITVVTSFANVGRRVWLNIKSNDYKKY
ncbi:MAG: hypothetical protein ACM3WQ_04270, partial [Chloroflexota bacterium]